MWAVDNGFVSVVPQFDMTAHHAIAALNTWDVWALSGSDSRWVGLLLGLLAPFWASSPMA